jgi:glycine cleavage system H protein
VSANDELRDQPELINDSPYEDGWMLVVKMSNPREVDSLMNAEEYKAYLQER